ncbi:alpha-hydroxy-acid oxidizing protein [Pseudochelatococcus sp. B33]
MALGARACLVAHPWLWGLAVGSEAGVTTVLDILRTEIDNTLALIDRTHIDEPDESALFRCL